MEKYSLTTLLSDLLRIQKNGYEVLSKLSDVVSSNSDAVEFDISDNNGNIEKITIPSFGNIKSQLLKLENDIKNLSAIGDAESSVQLSDGSFRKILISNLQKEAKDIKSLSAPLNFNTKENWFFESFLNPLLYVTFNLTNQIKYNTENVEISRFILTIDTQEKLNIFNERFNNISEIKYTEFYRLITNNSIAYFLDKEVIDLPPRSLRYFGNFTVTDINDDTISDLVDGITFQKRVLRLKLDKLVYNDTNSEFLGTQQLKIGDFLIVNNEIKNTRYEIVKVESENRTILVKLVEGYDPINIGVDVLSYYSENKIDINVNVNIGFNEYSVIFIRAIDPDSKIVSTNWSPGVGLYTNDLTIKDTNGNDITLEKYYQDEVIDFGQYLYSIAKDKIIPSTVGVEPNTPLISADNFNVVQINNHITDTSVIDDLKKLQEDKIKVQTEINVLNSNIKDLTLKIETTSYTSKKFEDNDRNQLKKYISEKNSMSSLYNSIIDDINKLTTSNDISNVMPKYRVRGFFPFPEAKGSAESGLQEVVQFRIQYRYLKKDGSANNPQQITFEDNNGETKQGTFSNWVEYKTEIRKREVDPITGNSKWVIENVENAEEVNINSLDIAISRNEAVEFRIKSISEAGFPINPKESIWSNTIKIDFPVELEDKNDLENFIDKVKQESILVDIDSNLNNIGLYQHLQSAFSVKEDYYAHSALNITSGFLSSEQTVISLFDKLSQMDKELTRLRNIVDLVKGKLVIRIIDENGKIYTVEKNNTIRIFAGNYKDEVADLTIKKGQIITKTYFLNISNAENANLELNSRYYGSFEKLSDIAVTDTDYNNMRKYELVPLTIQNTSDLDLTNYNFISEYPTQSAQSFGQYLNLRFKTVNGSVEIYGDYDKLNNYFVKPKETANNVQIENVYDFDYTINSTKYDTSTDVNDFIWNQGINKEVTSITNVINDYSTNIFVHISHPEIDSWRQLLSETETATIGHENILKNIRNSVYASLNKKVNPTRYFKQSPYYYDTNNNLTPKIGFEENDSYLIGSKSVGAYLFLNPGNYSDIRVNSDDSLGYTTVLYGNNNSINIPIIFQYRMTDFYGEGNDGIGNINGELNYNESETLEFTKRIGIDLFFNPKESERFSFDIEVTARYSSKNLVNSVSPNMSYEVILDDLGQAIKSVNPNISTDANIYNVNSD